MCIRDSYGGIAKVIGKNGSGIQVSDGVQRQIAVSYTHLDVYKRQG